ncbi:MAG: M48 family metalloprotease [Methylococcaceae bacterium]|nr:M48 family metalloprotease [Methylococcaceae bacterium]
MDLIYKNEKKLFIISCIIASVFWLVITLGTLGIIFLYILIGYLFFLFAHSAFITHLKGNGVRITEEQYPDLYESLLRNSEKVGLHHVPDAYLLRTDFFNALATRFRGRNFVVLFTDVVDALESQPSAIDFYIGHELGHLHRKHIQWGSYLFFASWVPLLGPAYRRSQEYTCDRYGAMCCNNDDDIVAAISTMSAGDSRWNSINLDAYLKQITETNGFWMSFNELNNDYPWLTKRMASALAFKQGKEIDFPRRHGFAWFLSAFIPRFGGGAALSVMMTIVMLGVLAAVAIPAYQDYIDRSEGMAFDTAIKLELEQAYQQALPLQDMVDNYADTNENTWPTSLNDLGIEEGSLADPAGRFDIDIYEDGIIGIEVIIEGEDEQYIVLESVEDEDTGEYYWICYGQDVAWEILPDNCQ